MAYRFIQKEQVIPDQRFSRLTSVNQALMSLLELTDEQYEQLTHPRVSLPCQDQAVLDMIAFLQQCQQEKRKVIICGDYDCDGVCSTSMMVLLCRMLDIETGFYIPNRLEEGYGLRKSTIELALSKAYDTLICVDNGVSAFAALDFACEQGMKVAVIDHHIQRDPVSCDVLLHPDVLSPYYASMCAGGLVYLLWEHFNPTALVRGLACVATIGDMMPLWHKNRELVKGGLTVLNHDHVLALDLLKNDTGAYQAMNIAFQIVPKINAVGRLSNRANPNNLVRYFCDFNAGEQKLFVDQIQAINDLRKQMTKSALEVAYQKYEDDAVLVIEDSSFHEGIVGIVAGQLSSLYKKPVIVLANREGILKGSGRSNSVSLHHLLSQIDSSLLINFGGHAQAAGLELEYEHFAAFKQQLNQFMESEEQVEETTDVLLVSERELTLDSLDELGVFEPFGQAFTLPLIGLPVHGKPVRLGKSGYKWNIGGVEVVYFTTQMLDFANDTEILAIGTCQKNQFRNKITCQFVVRDYIGIDEVSE